MTDNRGFIRHIGYDNADVFRNMLLDSYIAVQEKGLFFNGSLPLASTAEISEAAAYTAAQFEDAEAIQQGFDAWLRSKNIKLMNSAQICSILAEAIQSCGTNKRNTYFVMLCWLMKYLSQKHEKILYIGAASLRELYLLYMMRLAGSEITYVSYGEDSDFAQFPYKDEITNDAGPLCEHIEIDFENIDLSKEAQLSDMRNSAEKYSGLVVRADTSAAGIFEDYITDHKKRVIKRGGAYTDGCEIPVYFAALIGYDEEAVYTNMLLKFKESFAGLKKQLIFIENTLDNPDVEETKALGSIPRSSTQEMVDALAMLIKLNGDPMRTALAQSTLREMLNGLFNSTGNQTVVMNYGSKLVTWLYRCTQGRKYAVQYEDIPVILYYGDISQAELFFLHFMSRCGFDVVYITPNKSMLDMTVDKNEGGRMQIFQLPLTKESGKYPDKPVKMKMATVAYSAERELDTMLYNGDAGIFRDFQFPNSQAITLKTTFEEIGILWKHESKFRSGFSVSGNLVSVPNIFAKISGVRNGDEGDYWDEVRSRLTPETIIYIKENKPAPDGQLDLTAYRSFYRNGQIDIQKLKASPLNRYSYLPDRIQDLIFYKFQEAADSGYIKLQGDDLMCSIIHYGLGFDKDLLKLLQRFDFTKQIPKLIYIDVVEATFTLEECIRTVLCNLLGFDILVYTPTGYKNLETFVDSRAFEEHTMDEFLYNMEVPKLKIPSDDKNSGFFGRLFRKG
ncbi:MAG: hypothetical protein IJZ95_05145 [Oscillospiraceae bacterium]|nr:hypothetical protein [Oscillospiraceae bacterium]